jgi:ATPase subunit of ABC transporter with duplicated ATPase domains
MLIARDLKIEVGIRTLLSNASFAVHAGDKVGLVGPNGAGKTTMMRCLAGERPPDEGKLARSGVIGYLSQESRLPELEEPGVTALERVLMARDIGGMQRRMEQVRLKMEVANGAERDRLIRQFGRLEDEFTARGGYVAEAEAKRFAASVGIGNAELEQPVATMSGGQRRRVELARILFATTDILLLDEPTNHLDLDAKAWLMEYLASYPGGLLVVSHDLPLLDEAITTVLAVEDGTLEHYRGNYSHYLEEREQRRERKERERRHQQEEIGRLQANIARFKHSSEKMAKKARSWETRVERMKGDLVELGGAARRIAVAFPEPEPSGRIPVRASGLAKAFDDEVVFLDVDLLVERGERLVIMGLNGAGKTTLLRILAGVETADLGEVELGYRVSLGYYAQEHEQIIGGRSVFDHMRQVSAEPDKVLRSLLGHFLLADKVEQNAATLSGGEKTKLALAQIVAGKHNLLLLDEPTNNLDPQAKEALLVAVRSYPGTLVLVSHDTEFVAAVQPDRAVLMPDGLTRYFDESMLDLVALA